MTHIRFSVAKILALGLGGVAFLFSTMAYAVEFSLNSTPDVATMLVNFSDAAPNLMRMVTSFAYVMGCFLIVKGLLLLKQFGEARSMMSHEHSLAKPLTVMAVGALLLYLPSSVRTGLSTFWVDPNPYGYLPSSDAGDNWADLTTAAFTVIQLVGTVSFIKGLVMFTHLHGHGGQPGAFSKAITHVIAGILCINLYQFLQAIFSTLGLGTLSS